ncbi:MAG: 3'-5' exonuclease [Bacteroidales bacterium]|nr:3'-5' exonuclease [Bacteroidales bacterium]
MMLDEIKENNILFLDIETVPEYPVFEEMPENLKDLWIKKTKYFRDENTPETENFYERAGIFAEFGKIICISVGFISNSKQKRKLRIKSFYSDNETELLSAFIKLLNSSFYDKDHYLCAHNGKEFDFPYIARRILINNLKLPKLLNIAGKKPWEIKHLDTLELWKFGDYKHYTSLNLLTAIFNIPSPKDDINGSDVAKVYWEEKNLDRIVTYCEKDVVAIVQLYLKYRGQDLIFNENIESVK